MPDSTVTIRVNESTKHLFEEFCSEVGINMSVAVNMFIYAVLREGRIPFQIASPKAQNGLALLREMRAEAEHRGFLSDDDIEAEIKAARTEIKARR